MAKSSEDFVLEQFREISLLESALGILSWDMESHMPTGGTELRGKQLGLLSGMLHGRETEAKFVEAALALKDSIHGPRLKRRILSSVCVDQAFVSELSETQVRCQHEWKAARKAKNFAMVQTSLDKLVQLQREWARRYQAHPAIRDEAAKLSPFEVMFGLYEPGFPQKDLERLLGELGPELAKRIPLITQKQSAMATPAKIKPATTPDLTMPESEQHKLCQRVAADLGFDFKHGRLDKSAHPFCGGTPEDTRITTRYEESDFTNALSSVIHETGHALYEQGLPKELLHTPAGAAASLGLHESQSRFFENQIGRSLAFCEYLGGLTGRDPHALHRHLNEVSTSLIRVDADEVTYNLHILVRVDIERRLINGEIETADLPRIWNEGYGKLLGLDVPDDGDGCLQDVHWYGGAFGYFATYTLGNLIAANLFRDFKQTHPDWENDVRRGQFAKVRDFLRERVHRHAALHDSPTTIRLALHGRELSVAPFLEYIDQKYLAR